MEDRLESQSSRLSQETLDSSKEEFVVRISVVVLVILTLEQSEDEFIPGIGIKVFAHDSYCIFKVGKQFLSLFVIQEAVKEIVLS